MSLPAFTQVGGDSGNEISGIATEAMTAGMIYAWGPWFIYVDGNEDFSIGDLFNGKDNLNLRSRRVASAFTSATVAVGADIYVETSTGLPKTAGGAGIIGPVGKAIKAKASGVEYVEFRLNSAPFSTWTPMAAQQTLAAGGGAVNVTSYYTAGASDAGGDAWTLADGTRVGQLKKIQLVTDGGGDATLTPTNLSGGTTITFADAGDYALLVWNGSDWVAIELGNDADGATAPVLA